MNEVKYRIKQYSASGKAWQIDVEKINEKTGVARWETIKYPGNMLQAAETAVALQLGDGFTAASLDELVKAVENAVETLVTSFNACGDCVEFSVKSDEQE